ncbi:hypothetical protein [Streptomyces axinellae]|uniref:Uncharacterized protein n=1 Tax=Streptomyces axinellae TaxID=552788 RepID=A0ABN3QJ97_9ACTN
MDQTTYVVPSEAVPSEMGIARLYGLSGEEGYPTLIRPGTLPTRRRQGAPEWENKARHRLHDLLKPSCRAKPAEARVLEDAQIPLQPRGEGGGFHIDPGVERESENARAESAVDSAMGIARLYGLPREEGRPALIPPGTLPAFRRKGAPEWENKARHRLHSLLTPRNRASDAEVRVLEDAQIPLQPRGEGGGFHIDPGVERESENARAVPSEMGIARLYGLSGEEGRPALIPPGTLPAFRRKGAPEWENKARQRLHDLHNTAHRASDAEVRVLRDAQIPLQSRGEGGGFRIDRGVERESENAWAVSGVDSAMGIARLYGLPREEGYPALIPPGTLPAAARKGAPEWENTARKRLHHLLNPAHRAKPAEVRMLQEAQIPLQSRGEGRGFRIDPGVERESENARAVSAVDSAMGIARLYGLPREEGYPALIPPGTLPAAARKGAPEWENTARKRLRDLLQPSCRASDAEMRVLRDAQIPLQLRREGGGFRIDRGVERESENARAVSAVDSAMGIARLYGLPREEGYPALIRLGTLPAAVRNGAPEWEIKARRRLHDLLQPSGRASDAEVRVLKDAQIPLQPRGEKRGFHIAPGVERARDLRSGARASVEAAAVHSAVVARMTPGAGAGAGAGLPAAGPVTAAARPAAAWPQPGSPAKRRKHPQPGAPAKRRKR